MDFGSDFLDDVFRKRNIQGLGDFHLRSALTEPSLSELRSGKGRNREIKAYKRLTIFHQRKDIKNVNLTSLMFTLLNSFIVSPSDEGNLRGYCHEETLELLKLEMKSLTKILDKDDLFCRSIKSLENLNFRSRYTPIKTELCLGLMLSLAKNSNRRYYIAPNMVEVDGTIEHKVGSITFWYWGEFITVKTEESGQLYLLTLDHYRMLCDKATERDNVLIAASIGEVVLPDVYPAQSTLQEIFHLFDEHLRVRGNDGYKLLKAYEALTTGYILSLDDTGYWNSSSFLTSTLENLDSDEDRLVAHNFLRILRRAASVHHLTQICGLFRLWGHPIIDALEGLKKVKRIADVEKVIIPYQVCMAGRAFKEIFYISYFKKNGAYPRHEIIGGEEDDYLLTCLKKDILINEKEPLYDWMSWDNVISCKTFDIPETFNLSMIVADTAISPTRTELAQCYKDNRPALNPEIRRGVIKWMKDGMIDCGSLLRRIERHDIGLPKDHRAIGLYPKEREMNPVARMFALTTLLLRSYIVVTESMLSDNILKYIPGITMTHSLLQLTKEMIRMTWRQKDDSEIGRSFCINMDFEKWNINMREESTHDVFLELGRLFGLQTIYNKTYSIFKHSLVYLADGSFIPPVDPLTLDPLGHDPRMYLGHKGGFEGLRQKGWTIFTVVIIARICKEMKIDWQLMGQGDNQVLMVTIYSKYARRYGIDHDRTKRDIQDQLDKLIKRLIREFEGVGLALKPLETWVSDSFFSYGKVPLYKGVPCASSLKKISRVFYFSNEDLMTLDNALGAVGANAQSAVMGDVHPIIPYIMAKWQQVSCVKLFKTYHPLLGEGLDASAKTDVTMFNQQTKKKDILSSPMMVSHRCEILILSSLPKTLGGYNTVNYFRMMMRGFPDPQNMDFQWLTGFVREIPNSEFKQAMLNLTSLMLNNEVNYSYLIQDVTGLNLYIPTNSTQVIKDMIHRTIDSLNFTSEFAGWFKTVLHQSEHENIKPLIEELCKGDELNVRLLHDIVGGTLFGYCDSITSKIDKTVTLSRMALGSEDVVSALIRNEIRFFSFQRWRYRVPGNLVYEGGCPSEYIRKARRIGWRKVLIGVDTPFPFCFIDRNPLCSDRVESFINVMISDYARSDSRMVTNSVGKALPYLGSMTKEKLGLNSQRLSYGNEPLLTRPVNLLRTIGWFIKDGSNYSTLFRDMVTSVSDLDPEIFIIKQDRVKGNMIHRYRDEGTKHGSLWMPLFGPATFLNLSTNEFTEYSKGSKNVTIHFQALLCFVQYVAVNSLFSSVSDKNMKFYRSCKSCIEEVPEDFSDLPAPIDPNLIPKCKENPYLYITEDRIPREIRAPKTLFSSFNSIDVEEIPTSLLYSCMTSWLAQKICSQILSGDGSDIERGLIDIGGLSRMIYLKINPMDLLGRLASVLWVSFSRQPKYLKDRRYPSWSDVQGDIVRTLSRSSLSHFNIFGGYFLWEETKIILEHKLKLVHSAYPMTATSIANVSREAIIKYILATRELVLPSRGILIPGSESQMEALIKMVVLQRLRREKSPCAKCEKAILNMSITTSQTIKEISTSRCDTGHHIIDMSITHSIKRLSNITPESVFDLLPTTIENCNVRRLRIRKFTADPRNKTRQAFTILTNNDVPFSQTDQPDQGKLVFMNEYSGTHLRFGSISRGVYRAGELNMVIPPDRQGNLLVLGDGFGGTSLGFNMFGHWKKIWSWTYIDVSEGIPHSSQLSKPPLHFTFETNVDYNLSFQMNSIVGTHQFHDDFISAVKQYGIDCLISDIEWWYLGEDKTLELMSACYQSKVSCIYLRIFLEDSERLIRIVRRLVSCYQKWKIFFTDSASPKNNSGWLMMYMPRDSDITVNPDILGVDGCLDLIQRGIDEYSYYLASGRDSKMIDEMLAEDENMVMFYKDLLISHFRDAGIVDFLKPTLTDLYLSLRTGKRPELVSHMSGNTLYYDREMSRHVVLLRLLLLACSMLKDTSCSNVILDRYWELVWLSNEDSSASIRRFVRTNIVLQSSMRKKGNLTEKEKRTILSNVTLLKEMRRSNASDLGYDFIEFEDVGRSITFKYIPRHRLLANPPQHVFFLVSKVLSYNLID